MTESTERMTPTGSPSARRILVLELSPTLEEIWALRADAREGYQSWDRTAGVVTISDAGSADAKIRPSVLASYAGGKGTNVARVLGALRPLERQPYDVALLAVHPAGGTLRAAARHFDELAAGLPGLEAVGLHIPMEDVSAKQRRAVHIVDAESGSDILNFTPRLRWERGEVDRATRAIVNAVRAADPDELVLTGTPPLGAERIYADVIPAVRSSVGLVALDTSGPALAAVLQASEAHPDLLAINRREYDGQTATDLAGLCGTLAVHDDSGCWYWQGSGAALESGASGMNRLEVARLTARYGPANGPTLGAGDALLAGLLACGPETSLADAIATGIATAAEVVRTGIGLAGFTGHRVPDLVQTIRSE